MANKNNIITLINVFKLLSYLMIGTILVFNDITFQNLGYWFIYLLVFYIDISHGLIGWMIISNEEKLFTKTRRANLRRNT